MDSVHIHDKEFSIYLSNERISEAVAGLAAQLRADYADKNPLVIPVLNGAFMFAADLIKSLDFPLEINFVQLNSYLDIESSGSIQEVAGLPNDLEGRHVIVVEDIVDTGTTIEYLLPRLKTKGVASASVCALLFKPSNYKGAEPIKYRGFEIPPAFVVGYGLDYNGLGRNLNHIYQLKA